MKLVLFFFKGTLNLTHFSKTHLTTSSFCAATSNLSSQVSSSASRCWTFLIRKLFYIINIFVGNTTSWGFFLIPKETLFFPSAMCTPVQTCHFQLGPLQTLFLVFQSLSCHNLSTWSDFWSDYNMLQPPPHKAFWSQRGHQLMISIVIIHRSCKIMLLTNSSLVLSSSTSSCSAFFISSATSSSALSERTWLVLFLKMPFGQRVLVSSILIYDSLTFLNKTNPQRLRVHEIVFAKCSTKPTKFYNVVSW